MFTDYVDFLNPRSPDAQEGLCTEDITSKAILILYLKAFYFPILPILKAVQAVSTLAASQGSGR